MTFMATLIIVGHWLDFYQMVFPGVFKDGEGLNLFDIGIAVGFIGLIIFVTTNALSKHSIDSKEPSFFQRKYYTPYIGFEQEVNN